MSHNPTMTSGERVLWRIACQAAFDAARAPEVEARAKSLKKALAGAGDWRMPDLRSLPCACFRAFYIVAKGFALEADPALRAQLAPKLEALADAAGDMLDGLGLPATAAPGEDPPLPLWTERKDLS
jgi:hypothetical protein